jgi:protein O-GlcNAc transferase
MTISRLSERGLELAKKGLLTEAIEIFKQAVFLNENDLDALYNLALAYQRSGSFDNSLTTYKKLLNKNPEDSRVINNMGTVYRSLGKKDKAIKYYKKALVVYPGIVQAYQNLKRHYRDYEFQSVLDWCHEEFIKYNPSPIRLVELAKVFLDQCDWSRLHVVMKKIKKDTDYAIKNNLRTAEEPMFTAITSDDLERNDKVARSWSNALEESVWCVNPRYKFEKKRRKKLRIGYLSGDFRNHAMGHVTADLYGLHDRRMFEVFCFSYGIDDKSFWRKKVENDSDSFIDVMDKDPFRVAQIIYKNEIDILVDLGGYSVFGGPDVCVYRPAPVQVTYLGYPGTTGASFYDYIIVDEEIVPKAHKRFFRESLVYLPDCYQIYSQLPGSKRDFDKRELGFSDDDFIFVSFNRPRKYDQEMFSVWLEVLKKVPNGKLWLLSDNNIAKYNLIKFAKNKNINEERLVFAEYLPLGEHLQRLKFADLALDTRLYSGGATTVNALAMGVPVIALKGKHYLSRMSSSLLTACGLQTAVTKNLKEYEDLAVVLATDRKKLMKFKDLARKAKNYSSLFNTKKFVRNLEEAYKNMWTLYVSSKKPKSFAV